MKKTSMDGLVAKFLASYDAPAMDAIWRGHSSTFRKFWSERVLPQGTGPISDGECDTTIQILDRHGKGNTKTSQAVARVMVPQGAWRRMINSIHTNRELALVIDTMLKGNCSGLSRRR